MAEIQKNQSTVGNAEMAQRFVQFVMMQAQNIFYVLGKIPSPDGRAIPPNLEAGKLLIDQLEMVQEKTRNNLSTQETQILEDALKNVRLAFVEIQRRHARQHDAQVPARRISHGRGLRPGSREDAKPEPAAVEPESAPHAPPSAPPAAPAEESKKKFTKSYG